MAVSIENQPSKVRWGELDEEEDGEDYAYLLPPRQVIGPDHNGVKKLVEHKFNDEGNKVKITTTTRVRKLANARLSKRAVERRSWPKFADAVHEDLLKRFFLSDLALLLWEAKMMQAGSILGPIERSAAARPTITPVHDLNVPYEGGLRSTKPLLATTDMLFPPTPMQAPLPGTAQTPLPVTAEFYNIPTGGTPFTPGDYHSDDVGVSEMKPGDLANSCSHLLPG